MIALQTRGCQMGKNASIDGAFYAFRHQRINHRGMRGTFFPALFFLLLIFTGLQPSFSAKLRSWIGPINFIEGTIPSKRRGPCIVEIDEKIYIFGGSGDGEEQEMNRILLAVAPVIPCSTSIIP
jgi:hypothetical protein